MIEILENKEQWSEEFRSGWLAYQKETGISNWRIYNRPTNELTPGLPGIKLNESRLMLISSAGGYWSGHQKPFDAASVYGDYSIRTFPISTPFDALAFAHDHYDHAFVDQDPQVALPLRHLEQITTAGHIGRLTPSVISFMGYQPDSARVVDEVVPEIISYAKADNVHAALLAPT
jgi:hypothetical protein